MDIIPDTKDWTWVLDRPCPECGFDTRELTPAAISSMIRDNTTQWQSPLAMPAAHVRPDAGIWSPLEYACHVRDVFRLFDERLALLLTMDDPQFSNWNQDDTAVAGRYGEQDPSKVAVELVDAGEQIATHFDQVAADQWQRAGRRSDGAVFTVDALGRYMVHDIVHHIREVVSRA